MRLEFAFRDLSGERVEMVAEALVCEDPGLEGVRLGVDFLRGVKGVIERENEDAVLVLGGKGGRRVRVERV